VIKVATGSLIPFTKNVIGLEKPPERGDEAIFDYSESGMLLVKRVVAVGGDRVVLRNGRVFIDGRYFGTIPATGLQGRACAAFWRRSDRPVWMPL